VLHGRAAELENKSALLRRDVPRECLYSSRQLLRDDDRCLDTVQSREVLVEVSLAFRLHAVLGGAACLRSAFPVAAIELIDNLHPL